jgi:hypothetical protein
MFYLKIANYVVNETKNISCDCKLNYEYFICFKRYFLSKTTVTTVNS